MHYHPGTQPPSVEGDQLTKLLEENERLRASLKEMQAADEGYRLILQSSSIPCWIVRDGVISFANSAALAMLHAQSQEGVLGHALSEFLDADLEAESQRIQAALDTGIGQPQVNISLVAVDGSQVSVQAKAMPPLQYDGGKAVLQMFVDRTERRKFEKAMAASERNLRLMNDNTTEVILAYDMDRKLIYANPAFEKLTGFTLSEIFAHDFILWVHPDDQKRMLQLWDKVFLGEGYSEQSYRMVTKAGDRKWVSASWSPLLDEAGKQVGVQGRERDVTLAKEAEDSRQQSEEQFRLAFAYAAVGVAITDSEGRFLEVNPALCKMLGYSEAELKGMDFRKITHPEDLEKGFYSVQRMLYGYIPGYVIDQRYVRKDEAIGWARISITVIRSPDGTPSRMIRILEEATEQKRAEEALISSENRFRRVFELSPLGTVLMNREAKLLKVNSAFCDMLEYSMDELLSMRIADFTHPDDRQASDDGIAAIIRGETNSFRHEKRYITKSGETVHALISGVLISENPWEMLGIAKDITELKKAEAARRESDERLRQAQKMEAMGMLAGGIAHDFNNLLTVISGYSDWMLGQLDPGDVHRAALIAIHEAGEKAAVLTKQLLAFGRKQFMQTQVFDLLELVRRILTMLERLIREDISLHSELPEGSIWIQADPAQLEQVIFNLAMNAIDATPPGGRLTIDVSLRSLERNGAAEAADLEPGNYAVMAIRDTGKGMDPETLRRSFEPFFTTKESGKGTGLGLPMAYGIARQSGGTITVASRVGEGSTFSVYLPVTHGQPAAETPAKPSISTGRHPRRSNHATILLVEDSRAVRQWAEVVLQENGYRVLSAANAEQALQTSAGAGRIDLLVTDLVMPGMNGRQLADKLAVSRPNLPVLFTSGYPEDTLGEFGNLAQGVGYLPKPCSPDALLSKVSEVLGRGVEQHRIVLADDDSQIRTLLGVILEHAGYVVRTAANGREAMTYCRNEPTQLLITDLAMPEQEGIETIRAAKLEFPHMRIMAISGVFTGSFSSVPLKLGADVVLEKPILAEDLLQAVDTLIG